MEKKVTKQKKTSWPKIGTIRTSELEQEDGSKVKSFYMKLESNVEIFIDGKKVQLRNQCLKLQDPRDVVRKLLVKGVITEEDADYRLGALAQHDWLKFEAVAIPPKN